MKTFDEAVSYLVSKAKSTHKTETVPVSEALGRVLAEPIVSSVNVPPHDNSQMDGYALHLYDLTHEDTFSVSQRIPAGSHPQPLECGTIARIFTGAPIPENANAVVMQEETEMVGDKVKINVAELKAGENIRRTGDDIRCGETILEAGHRLRAQDLGLITSIGIGEVTVFQRLKIATFTTGDELLEPGEAPQPGKIFNANRYVLAGAVPQLGFELIDLGHVEDSLEATVEAMKQAAAIADVVMTTGGVSVGEEDHIKPAIDQLGSLDMWKVKMKPGKPLAYGDIQGTPFIGLPGNPVSAFATFSLFARPYLLRMQGVENICLKPIWAQAAFDWTKPGFRREFARARLVSDKDSAQMKLELYHNQSSGVLNSTVWADGFAVIPEDSTIQKGDLVAFYSFNDMI